MTEVISKHIAKQLGVPEWVAQLAIPVPPALVKLFRARWESVVLPITTPEFLRASVSSEARLNQDCFISSQRHIKVVETRLTKGGIDTRCVSMLAKACMAIAHRFVEVMSDFERRELTVEQSRWEATAVCNFKTYKTIWSRFRRTSNGGTISFTVDGKRRAMGNQCFWISLAHAIRANGGPKELHTGWGVRALAESTGHRINAPGRMVEMTVIDSKESVTDAICEVLKRCGLKLVVINRTDLRRGKFGEAVARWLGEERPFQLTVGGVLPPCVDKKGNPDMKAFNALDRVPVVIVNLNGGHYEFASVLEPLCWGGIQLHKTPVT